VWTVTAAGALLAVPTVLAAALVALVRRSTGNRYALGTVLLFALLGILGTAVLPLLGFVGVATSLRQAALGVGSPGLTSQDVADLQDAYCFLPAQVSYLGDGRSVSEALTALPGPDVLLAGRAVVLLVIVPLLALVLTWVLARLAVRRGPAWPATLLWLPFLGLVFGTLPLNEGVVGQLWLGYLMGIVPGVLLILLIGRPRWSVINRGRPASTPAPQQRPAPPQSAPQQRPAPPQSAPQQRPAPRQPVSPQPPRPTKALPPRPGRELPPTRREPASFAEPGRPPPGPAAAPSGRRAAAGRDDGAGGPRFRKLHRLGEGGFGAVWLAMDTALDREVAIKVARAPDRDTEQRIRREARALAAVHHPHCVRVYDILTDVDDLPGLAIVMEYVPGRSLAQQIRDQGPLSDTEGAHLWSTMAGALDAAHRRGVMHRDVKPPNIIIDDVGRAHLIDFGIARTQGDPALTAAGIVIGTPDFLSPEAAAGAAADPRTDSWQLAATVSYALSGRPPRGYRSSSVAALQAAVSELPTQLPEHSAHCHLLELALHPEPSQRPTLAAVQTALAQWLARTGQPAHGPVTRTLAGPPQF
jgi:tRNA A-37 threonylcarbamoyl transferase component Bud32